MHIFWHKKKGNPMNIPKVYLGFIPADNTQIQWEFPVY